VERADAGESLKQQVDVLPDLEVPHEQRVRSGDAQRLATRSNQSPARLPEDPPDGPRNHPDPIGLIRQPLGELLTDHSRRDDDPVRARGHPRNDVRVAADVW
jgi:hypothetical protein